MVMTMNDELILNKITPSVNPNYYLKSFDNCVPTNQDSIKVSYVFRQGMWERVYKSNICYSLMSNL